MPATFYKSTDTGAPVLAGNTAETLINVLDKVLVTGYGSKAGAGWSKPYTATNVAVFRNGATAGARRYLRVSEPTGVFASVRGYHDMTDANTGSTPFPSTAQRSSDLYWHKTSTSDSSARQWWAIADERTLLLLVRYSTSPQWTAYYFGDGISYVSGDEGFCVIAGSTLSATGQGYSSTIGCYASDYGSLSDTSLTGIYIGGPPTGPGSVPAALAAGFGRRGCVWHATTEAMVSGRFAYPNLDGSIPLNQIPVVQPTSYTGSVMAFRGRLRFAYDVPVTAGALNEGDTFSGTGSLSGKAFTIVSRLVSSIYYNAASSIDNILAVTPDD